LSILASLSRSRLADVALGAVATAFGAVSLWYPFGRDQGLFYYAAREWLLRDQVLYRDVWDHKPPVIYFIHMAVIAILGQHPWGIRAVELFIAVPLLAWLSARLVTPRGAPLTPGAMGAAWVAIAVFYFGYSNYWDTAQCEIWIGVFALSALVVASQAENPLRGAFGAGALSALALFTKPTAIFFVVIAFALVVARGADAGPGRFRRALRSGLVWFGGGVFVALPIFGYFAARRALAPMLDILVGANAAYVHQERAIHSFTELLVYSVIYYATLQPFSTLFVVGMLGAAFVGFSLGSRELVSGYLLAATQ
jgi:hypothetical protein